MKAYDISSTCIQFQTRILDVFVANKSIQLKYSIQCCALGLKFLSFPLTPVSLERKIRKLSPVAKEREKYKRKYFNYEELILSQNSIEPHPSRNESLRNSNFSFLFHPFGQRFYTFYAFFLTHLSMTTHDAIVTDRFCR